MSKVKAEDFDKTLETMETEVDAPEVKEEPKVDAEPKVEVKEEVKEEAKDEPKVEAKTDGVEVKEAPKYEPNKKFKVHDDEFEFDKVFDPILTSKEVEEKLRDLHAKAYGLEAVKTSRDKIKTDFDEVKKEIEQITPAKELYKKALELAEKKDYESATQCLTASILSVYTEDEVLAAAEKIAGIRIAKDPMEKARLERDILSHKENFAVSREKQSYEEKVLSMEAQLVNRDIDFISSQPDVKAISEVYDKAYGKGSFVELVKKHGHYMSITQGKTYPVRQAFEDKMNEIKPFLQNGTQTPAPKAAGQTIEKVVQPNDQKDGLPNLKQSGSAGRKSKVDSVEALEKRIVEMENEL